MIKPIIYHTIEEKKVLERKLMATIPPEKRAVSAKALMDIFYRKPKGRPKARK